jgi:alkyl hydroperoxide reductase subunit AhpC
MAVRIGDEAPDFVAQSTEGPIKFHDWIGNSWVVFFSHPKDFTPVCTTELGTVARLTKDFQKRNAKLLGLSVDTVEDHRKWMRDIEETQNCKMSYPVIGDPEMKVAKLYDMIHPNASGDPKTRTAADNATVRNVFFIGPDKKIKAIFTYPMSTGRNFDEVLRTLDSLELTSEYKVATPANWKPGEDVIISPSVSDEEAKKQYPEGWSRIKAYLRMVHQPHR